MPFMNAKYPGTCVTCQGRIKVGDEIYWSRETGASHRRACPKPGDPIYVDVTVSTSDGKGGRVETTHQIQQGVTAAPKPAPAEKMVPGVYEVDGTVYVVRMRKDKTGLYAMKMVEVGDGVVRATESGERVKAIEFEYVYGVVLGFSSKTIKLAHRMSVERAKELVTLYGRCIACNRHLKAASSVEKGIGPVCITYFGPFIEEVPVVTIDGREKVIAAA